MPAAPGAPYGPAPYGPSDPYTSPAGSPDPYASPPSGATAAGAPGQQPPADQPYGTPPSDPYGTPPSAGTSAYGAPAYGNPPYGAPPYGAPGYGAPGYGAVLTPEQSSLRTQAIVSLVVNIVVVVATCFAALPSIGGAVTAGIALGQVKSDTPNARKLVKWSWWLLAATFIIGALVVFGIIALIAATDSGY